MNIGFVWSPLSILGICGILLIGIGLHEFGHFLIAKWNRVKVDEFSIGFGPSLFSWNMGETRYHMRLIPAGGYVKLAGETGLENKSPSAHDFKRATKRKRIAILAAGGATNLLLAFILLTILAIVGGAAPSFTQNSPLTKYQDDNVVAINGVKTPSWAAQIDELQELKGKLLTVSLQNWGGGKIYKVQVRPVQEWISTGTSIPFGARIFKINNRLVAQAFSLPEKVAYPNYNHVKITWINAQGKVHNSYINGRHYKAAWVLYWQPGAYNPFFNTLNSPPANLPTAMSIGASSMWSETTQIAGIVGNIVHPTSSGAKGKILGPVGILALTTQESNSSLADYFTLLALISLNLGIFNLLPIPFLDGGHILFIGIEAVRGKAVSFKIENAIHLAGLAAILVLAVVITASDITNLIR